MNAESGLDRIALRAEERLAFASVRRAATYRQGFRDGYHEAEMDALTKITALTLCLKDLLRPNETLAAAVERAQLLLDAHEAQP